MADYRDVMNARSEADRFRDLAIKADKREGAPLVLAILTVALEIRALAVSLDYNESQRGL